MDDQKHQKWFIKDKVELSGFVKFLQDLAEDNKLKFNLLAIEYLTDNVEINLNGFDFKDLLEDISYYVLLRNSDVPEIPKSIINLKNSLKKISENLDLYKEIFSSINVGNNTHDLTDFWKQIDFLNKNRKSFSDKRLIKSISKTDLRERYSYHELQIAAQFFMLQSDSTYSESKLMLSCRITKIIEFGFGIHNSNQNDIDEITGEGLFKRLKKEITKTNSSDYYEIIEKYPEILK